MRQRCTYSIVLALLLVSCARAPKLPYDLRGLDADVACSETPVALCASLALSKPSAAPARQQVTAIASPAAPPSAPPLKGVVRLVISLPQQKLYAFRDDVLVGTSSVSTGRRGHSTPVGKFHILEKQVHHRSNRYSNAPMPYMERLTASGVALHAGHLPGYPASHGCIRLPRAFAKRLYRMTTFRSTVTITRARVRKAAHALKLV